MHFWKIDGDKIEAEDFHNTYDFKPTIKYGDFGKIYSFENKWQNVFNMYTLELRGAPRPSS